MKLDDPIWLKLEGGYRIPYDVSVPLKQLISTDDSKIISDTFAELWDNLHHQGDVGLASYLAVPQLVTICIDRKSLDWNFVGLCVIIENRRQEENNPKLPEEYQYLYLNALNNLESYLLANFKSITNETTLRLTLALFATLNGQANLGKAIENLDEDIMKEFLEQF
ncbi:MAG: hypothetical protein IPJ31_12705 [Bacteroidetes bacterium]|nr:hypothetical protein [Bacteroidota bacterium]